MGEGKPVRKGTTGTWCKVQPFFPMDRGWVLHDQWMRHLALMRTATRVPGPPPAGQEPVRR